MKFLKQLLNTKAPSNTTLLDIAILFSIIPHLFVMKFFMILYIITALWFILKQRRKRSDIYLLMLLGVFLIGVSFFNTYNFSDFSKIQFFVSLISAMLIYAVSLQKLTNEVNIYLKISPILLMILSFFFFNSIIMLLYSILTLFVFVLFFIWVKMDTTLGNVIKYTASLFVLSLPFVTILFLVFPRISIEKAEFGFRADNLLESAYDGIMQITSKEVKLSNRVAMEVLFQDANISDAALYFRGSTLYKQDILEWKKVDKVEEEEQLSNATNIIDYEVSIHPHSKNWVYALDIPIVTPKKVKRNADFTLSSKDPIYKIKKYQLKSALHYNLYSNNQGLALNVDTNKSERVYEALRYIREKNISKKEKAYELIQYFKGQKLHYTLKPLKLNLEDFTDSFLLDSKNGYCVHFASSFVTSARMLGIPARIVTGFKARKENMIQNYLIVRASDAHAWVELYFEKDGWIRFDPTTTALRNLGLSAQEQNQTTKKKGIFETLNNYFMYTKYIINNWLLDYDRLKQMEILENILNDTLYLLKFILGFLLLIFLSSLAFFGLKLSSCNNKLGCEIKKLLKILKQYGCTKPNHQTMQDFLQESEKTVGISLRKVNDLYHIVKYRNSSEKYLKDLSFEIQKVTGQLKEKKS